MISAPGQGLRITADAIVPLIKGVRNHAGSHDLFSIEEVLQACAGNTPNCARKLRRLASTTRAPRHQLCGALHHPLVQQLPIELLALGRYGYQSFQEGLRTVENGRLTVKGRHHSSARKDQ